LPDVLFGLGPVQAVGVADILKGQDRVSVGPDAHDYAPRSDVWLMVFERGRKS
jgi:hypothetical protein